MLKTTKKIQQFRKNLIRIKIKFFTNLNPNWLVYRNFYINSYRPNIDSLVKIKIKKNKVKKNSDKN